MGILFLLCFGLVSCSGSTPESLRIGTNLWVGYDPLYLARSISAFDGGSVRLVELPSTTDVLHALRSHTLEAAALTLDEVLSLQADGLALCVVLVMDYSDGADALVAHPQLQELQELRGRRIGYEESAVGALMLDAVLHAAQFAASDITPIPIGPDQHFSAFVDGRVDAVVTYEPALSRLREHGGKVLFDSSRLRGQIIDVLAVRAEVMKQQPEQVRSLVRGWFQALAFMQRDPDTALARMALRHQLDGETLARGHDGLHFVSLEENRRHLGLSGSVLEEGAGRLAGLMLERGLLARMPSLSHLAEPGALPQ